MTLRNIVILVCVVGVTVWYANDRGRRGSAQVLPQIEHAVVSSPTPQQFKCEGKTHCSQMSSCEEATFYIKNCPDTKMDGDRDGIPCESQWCQH